MLKAKGLSGELRAGGRVVAVLSNWDLETIGLVEPGQPVPWTLRAGVIVLDSFVVTHGKEFLLALTVGKKHWRWKVGRPTLQGKDGRDIIIVGEGSPEVKVDAQR